MPFATVRDIQMYYEIHGVGPRLLFISGTGGDLRQKPNVFDSPLSAHFEILAYDQRGLGQTDKPDVPYTMTDYALDADSLLDVIGWESCFVIGASFGGMVAQEFALRSPQRVERLVLACTSSGGAGGASYPIHEFVDLAPREKALRFLPLSDTRLDTAWQSANQERFAQLIEQMVEGYVTGANESGWEIGARRQLEARIGHDTYDRLPKLQMPVFIIGGRYDGIAPVSNLEAMHEQIPHARLELFEGGHMFMLQDARVYSRISAFLQDELD